MSTILDKLLSLLGLESPENETMRFGDYLTRLRHQQDLAGTAYSVFVRAIHKMGEIDIEREPPMRRPYLRMLKEQGIPLPAAFNHVRGHQRTFARILNQAISADSGGYQLFLAMLLLGGPGCGKSLIGKALREVMEGQVIYTVDGCPVRENPLNLLTLLPPARLEEIARALDMTDSEEQRKEGRTSLNLLMTHAKQPCHHCWSMVQSTQGEGRISLFDIKITGTRLSSRTGGVSVWTRGQDLQEAIKWGSGGIISLEDMCAPPDVPGGVNDELDDLHTVTNDRVLRDSEGQVFPIDTIIVGETNPGAHEAFLKCQTDPMRYTRCLYTMNVPYGTSVTDEELIYGDHLRTMRKIPHFDPMALKLAALLAVMSRMKKDHEVDIVTRARMYDGERLVKEKANPTKTNDTTRAGSKTSVGSKFWTVAEFWETAGDDEGMYGLTLPTMKGIISQIADDNIHTGCVSSIRLINFLRERIGLLKKEAGRTPKEMEILKNCEEFLRPPADRTSKPGLLEQEYRRVLIRQLIEIVSPEFEDQAAALFERYRMHAGALIRGEKEVNELAVVNGHFIQRPVKVDSSFLDELDTWMGHSKQDQKDQFRRSIEVAIKGALTTNNGGAGTEPVSVTWRTLPKLEQGIIAKLNADAAKRLEMILKLEIELGEQDKLFRRQALARLDSLGYCPHCREEALCYAKDYELWKLS